MPVTEAQAADLYNVIENAVVAILKAESTVTNEMGDGANSIEGALRNEPRDWQDDELPSLTIKAVGSQDDDAETEGKVHEIQKPVLVEIFALARGADLAAASNRVQTVAAVVEHFLRKQIKSNSELNLNLGGAADTIVKLAGSQFLGTQIGSQFETLATISVVVVVDICID